MTGRQPEAQNGAEFWVLPNPSGINAHYSLEDIVQMLKELQTAVEDEAHCR